MNSESVVNKVELGFYSTLISILSGINRLIGVEQQISTPVPQPMPFLDDETTMLQSLVRPGTLTLRWQSFKQGILTLLLWVVLGFAAGFLIGMLQSG
jgi:hypothetical protein